MLSEPTTPSLSPRYKNPKNNRPFTVEEREYVSSHLDEGDQAIALALGRSYFSVAKFRQRLFGKRRPPCVPSGALIDEIDVSRVAQYRWTRTSHGYFKARVNGRDVYLHRFIMQAESGHEVDHRNGNKADNRRDNLRVCSHQVNSQNVHVKGIRGVLFDRARNRWRAEAKMNGKRFYLGRFTTAEEAEIVVKKWRSENMPGAIE